MERGKTTLYDVHKQVGVVGKAFGKLNREEAVEKRRQALKEADGDGGWDIRKSGDRNEAKLIDKVVEDIWLELWSNDVSVNSKITGLESQIEEVLLSLGPGVGDVLRIIGITGPRGAGKTALARAVFDRASSRFEGKSFVENIGEVSKGSLSWHIQVLSDVLNEGISTSNVSKLKKMIEKMLGSVQVIAVLDDVSQVEQLEALVGSPDWSGKGSIIIITTSDEEMLLKHGVKQIHRVRPLADDAALCLFSWFAFGGDKPAEEFQELSLKVVHCAAGLPLAYKILGSFLRGKDKPEWKDMLQRLKETSLDEGLQLIAFEHNLEMLESRYSSLEDDTKYVFLYIACFMNGFKEKDAIQILESCGFNARDALRVLVRKSLLAISDDPHPRLRMYNCIEYMGKNLVRRSHPHHPNQHRLLWIREEIENILKQDLGTQATECMQLLAPQLSPNIVMEAVGSMEELKCLIVESEYENDDLSDDWEFDKDRQYLPNALRFCRWVSYPFSSLPATFRASNLVTLELPDSSITQLWGDGQSQVLNNLRFLNLSGSLVTTLDLRQTPLLEWLELKNCRDLEELLTREGDLPRLFLLDLTGCSRFDSFSYIKLLVSLNILSLSKLHLKAESLQEFARGASMPKLLFTCYYSDPTKSVSLNLSCTKLESISGSICGLQHLRHLVIEGCIPEVPDDIDRLGRLENLELLSAAIKRLPESICMLVHLKSLTFDFCQNLEALPEDLGHLHSLEKLSLLSAGIRRLPDSICNLKKLKSLQVKSCLLLEEVPDDVGRLACLEMLDLSSSRIRGLPDSLCMLESLKSLELDSCGLLERLPQDLGKLGCLEKLNLSECTALEDIPSSICEISNLKWLLLPFCDQVKELPEQLGQLKCLSELNVKGTGISELPQSVFKVKDLRIVASEAFLRLCDFVSEIQTAEGEYFCYI